MICTFKDAQSEKTAAQTRLAGCLRISETIAQQIFIDEDSSLKIFHQPGLEAKKIENHSVISHRFREFKKLP